MAEAAQETKSLESKTLILKENVESGMPAAEHFEIATTQVDPETLGEGGILVQVLVMSADPYMRGRIKSTGIFKPGKPLGGFIAGKVIASKNESWVEGDLLGAHLPFSTVQIVPAEMLAQVPTWKLTGKLEESNISLGIGLLGMPGATAYGGLIGVLRPNEGETVFVSAASGAVGSLVGMIAKQVYNCKVVGSCGGPVKGALIKEKFGYDASIDYKTMADAAALEAALREAAPEGIDMYFENVGGMHFTAAMATLRPKGRIAVCGQISQYNLAADELKGVVINPMQMIYTFQRIEGFVCSPWLSGQKGNFLEDMHQWLQEGKLVPQETFFEGIESWPEAFASLFTGTNIGKVVVRV